MKAPAGTAPNLNISIFTLNVFIFTKGMAILCLAAAACLASAVPARAQVDAELTAKQRVFAPMGPGLRAVKRTPAGNYYVLASPLPGLVEFDAKGKRVLRIGEESPEDAANGIAPDVVFGQDCDVDTEGDIYIADRGANALVVFSPNGKKLRAIHVDSPVSVAALPDGEAAVATLRGPQLVTVYDRNGREARDFGDPEPISSRAELNRFLNIGRILSDPAGHVYYGFEYFPRPTVRQYDRFGYGGQDTQYTAIDALPEAQAMQREILRQEQRGGAPVFKPVLTAFGVDPETGEIWMAMRDTLLHFDKEGNRRATYLIYTPDGASLDAGVIVVEKDRLLIGADPLGVYEFSRPDKAAK